MRSRDRETGSRGSRRCVFGGRREHGTLVYKNRYVHFSIGNPFASPIPPFLLPAYRKPKRIRTAFSPAQLLKLEQAFEKNQYVVGAERKELARNLNLTETQVSLLAHVWCCCQRAACVCVCTFLASELEN